MLVTGISTVEKGFAGGSEEQLVTAAIRGVILTDDQAILLHALDNTGGVAFGAEHPVAEVYVIDAGAFAEMHECKESGHI